MSKSTLIRLDVSCKTKDIGSAAPLSLLGRRRRSRPTNMWAMGSPSAKAAMRQVMARLEIEAIVKGKGALCIAVEASVQPRAAARPERKG